MAEHFAGGPSVRFQLAKAGYGLRPHAVRHWLSDGPPHFFEVSPLIGGNVCGEVEARLARALLRRRRSLRRSNGGYWWFGCQFGRGFGRIWQGCRFDRGANLAGVNVVLCARPGAMMAGQMPLLFQHSDGATHGALPLP